MPVTKASRQANELAVHMHVTAGGDADRVSAMRGATSRCGSSMGSSRFPDRAVLAVC